MSKTITNHSTRRMGPAGSDTWLAMLEGAEHVLRDEGYAALTSRRVAERIGVKQRLVYYYFHSMEDLIVATFRNLAVRELERLRQAAGGPRPLRALWAVAMDSDDVRLVSEFMALANRISALEAEVIAFIEESRALHVQAFERSAGISASAVAPSGLAMLAASLALTLNREHKLGIAAGHREARRCVEQLLDKLEPQRAALSTS